MIEQTYNSSKSANLATYATIKLYIKFVKEKSEFYEQGKLISIIYFKMNKSLLFIFMIISFQQCNSNHKANTLEFIPFQNNLRNTNKKEHRDTLNINVICWRCNLLNEYFIIDVPDSICYTFKTTFFPGFLVSDGMLFQYTLEGLNYFGEERVLRFSSVRAKKETISEYFANSYCLCQNYKLFQNKDNLYYVRNGDGVTYPRIEIYSSIDSTDIVSVSQEIEAYHPFPFKNNTLDYIITNIQRVHLDNPPQDDYNKY